MRLLLTGSRDWGLRQTPTGPEDVPEEIEFLNRIINHFVVECWRLQQPLIVIHGSCKTGADDFAASYVRMLNEFNCNVYQEAYPANWKTHGRRAGFVRNKYMVELGADACVAFIKNNSRGATMCANLAEESGIPTYRYRSPF